MRKSCALAALLLALGAPPAAAQSALLLNWDDCATYGGRLEKTFACNTNSGPAFVLYASVVVPRNLPRVVGADVSIGVILEGGTIPPWWQTEAGQCRASTIVSKPLGMDFIPPNLGALCDNIWSTTVGLVTQSFAVTPPAHAPFTFGLVGTARMAPNDSAALPVNGEEWVVCKIWFTRMKTVGATACAGCETGATFVFEECRLVQDGGAGDCVITEPYRAYGTYPTFNGGAPVPALNRTWGAVKGLYR
jgi:hypothetical protein